MIRRRRALLTASALAAILTAGAATFVVAHPTRPSCTVPAGGRCAGPEPVSELAVSTDGHTLSLATCGGGTLTVSEAGEQVRVTLSVASMGAGGMSCAKTVATAHLAEPLHGRRVIDTTSGHLVSVTVGALLKYGQPWP